MRQTIKIAVGVAYYGFNFSVVGGCFLGAVGRDFNNPGRYAVQCLKYSNGDNFTLPEALEFISDAISSHFASFGIDVDFIHNN